MTRQMLRVFDLLSREELAWFLSRDRRFVLPRGARNARQRLAEARDLVLGDYRLESLPIGRWRSQWSDRRIDQSRGALAA